MIFTIQFLQKIENWILSIFKKWNYKKALPSFEQDKSYAIIKVNFGLIKDKKKVVKSYSLIKDFVKTNDAYGFVEATNKGLEETINTLLKQLAN